MNHIGSVVKHVKGRQILGVVHISIKPADENTIIANRNNYESTAYPGYYPVTIEDCQAAARGINYILSDRKESYRVNITKILYDDVDHSFAGLTCAAMFATWKGLEHEPTEEELERAYNAAVTLSPFSYQTDNHLPPELDLDISNLTLLNFPEPKKLRTFLNQR